MDKGSIFKSLVLPFIALLAFGLYFLGVSGPFLLDDIPNLSGIAVGGGVVQLDDLLRYMFGMDGYDFSRPLSRLSFVLNDQYWPSWPYLFKLTNIAVHLMTGLLIALLLFRLLPVWLEPAAVERVALICAALWLLHPLHVSTTLYVVQRMTQLMVFFMLLSLIFYIQFRNSKSFPGGFIALFSAGATAVFSVLSKEGGAILLLLYPLLEWFCFRHQTSRFQAFSRVLSALLGLLFVGLFIAVAIGEYEYYDGRFYSLGQRLQIQGWVLLEYLRYIFLPVNAGMSLFHDDIEWRFQTQGLGYVGFYWFWHVALGVFVGLFLRRHRLIIFGLSWFYLSHLIESTVIPLELMFEHRNYLASIGLLLIVAYMLDLAASRLKSKALSVLEVVLIMAPLVYLSLQLAHRSALWSDYRILTHKWAVEHPSSLRSQYRQIVLLEQDGDAEKALEVVLHQEKVFDDLILPMYRVRLECELDPLANNESKLDIGRFSTVNYTSGIGPALKKLIQSPGRECIDRQLSNGQLGDLIAAVETMPLLESKGNYYAEYLDIVDDYYISNLQYTSAIIKREHLWEVQPTIPTALKLVELFILGGNYEQARYYLAWSVTKNQQRWFVDNLATRNILNLEQLLKNMEALQAKSRVSSD